jgi:hypothetical protein
MKQMINDSLSLAIILVNWNSYELTKRCLLSLKKVSYSHARIYLVDNGSKDGSGAKLRKEFTALTFIQNQENLGFTGGNNIAINQALFDGNELIMLLNNDTEVEHDFIEPLVKRLKDNSRLAAVQPLILDLNDRQKIWNAGGDFNRFFGLAKTRLEGKGIESLTDFNPNTGWITGCCVLTRSSVLNEIGNLNNKFFAYHEDVDWSIRMIKAGYSLGIVYESVIYHLSMATLRSDTKGKEGFLSPFMHYLHVRNHLYLIRIHPDFFNRFGIWLYQSYKFCGYMTYFLLRLRFIKLKSAYRGFKDGLSK